MRKVWKILKMAVLFVMFAALFGYVVMQLWNWLMPAIFGWHSITFVQAIGLLVLCKMLFGGFHKHGGGGRRAWKQQMEERFAGMSPQERERFRAGMRGCRWGGKTERGAEKEAGL